ncbi:MurR/RpiR family transcriptional regulator [Paenibacillus dakarensis]|uniref:MurR/RpiR family transcriptional regulator n=1 Tax=Paenibacillus dakarensis TaxID=1527293 RepID=UPI0006D5348B|nr:MurR/RpiR family transcriptional regulator [Paenibacillus dakarensis]
MHRSVLDELQLQYHALSQKEKEIADYIVQHKSSIQNINIRELADHTHSSTSTITRFCKKIHCESFVDFKIRLSREADKPAGNHNSFTQIQNIYNEIINSTADMMHEDDFELVVQKIKKANRVQVYGLGSSGLSALEFKYRLMRMNITIDAMTDSHMMIMSAALLNENDLIIGLSNSGQTSEIIEAMRIGKKNGAATISITNYKHTSLTDVSDISLYTPSLHRMGDTQFINSQLAIIYVLDVLSMLLLNDKTLLKKRQDTIETLYYSLNDDHQNN